MLRILHTGDIHLDSPFSGLDPRTAEVRRNELRAAFTSMMHYARMEKVDLILIAGDMFDADFVTRETLALIKKEAENTPCPIVISPGNHDSVSESSVWRRGVFPENVYIFTDETLDYFELDEIGVRVWGWAFTSQKMELSPLTGRTVDEAEGEGMINILCAHGDISSTRSTSCPLTVRELEAFGADYAALGHIHNPAEYSDRIAYCGCLEGRSFDETGHKGAVCVTIDGDSITSQRVRFSKRRYENETLRVDGAASNTELRSRISEFITEKHYGDDTILRLTITGETDPSFTINTAVLESDAPRLFALKIVDETSPMLDADALRLDPTLRGEFFRLLEPALTGDDPEARALAADALRMGLSALAGEAIV